MKKLPGSNNPTREQRHMLLKYYLKKAGRLEDYGDIISLMDPPKEIIAAEPNGHFKNKRVGIIGGGLAGLSAAYELRKLGFDITIFEALKNRIGGRVYTYYFDKSKNLYGELGPMRIPISHETTWYYIDLFNLNTRPYIQSNENTYVYIRDIRVRNDPTGINIMRYIYPEFNLSRWERNTPFWKLVEYGFQTPLKEIHPNVRREILQVKPCYHPQLLYWEGKNLRQVLQTMGFSLGAIDLISSIPTVASGFYYNSFVELLQEEYPVNFTRLYEIIGGFSNLPMAFYDSLTSRGRNYYGNVDIKMGHRVTEICRSSDKKVYLKYKDENINRSLAYEFDYIICAIPFSSLRTVKIYPMFEPRKMEAIREVNYATAQKTLFLCKRRFWEEDSNGRIIGGGSYTDLPIGSIWYPSDHGKYLDSDNNSFADEPGVLLASYNFNLDAIRLGNMDEKRRFEEIKRQVEEVHGLSKGYLDKIVLDYKTIHWNTQIPFKGAFCYFYPNQKEVFSYFMAKPEYDNRVFFAGEHISSAHAWQQGALQTGMWAANMLVKNCKGQL